MEYFIIENNTDTKIIGYYPQTGLKKGYDPEAGHRWVKSNKFPDLYPKFELKINSKAKPTNYLHRTIVNFGLVVDEKFKKILMDFKLPKHRFYPMKVYWDEIVLDYFWFHYIIDDFWDFVDLSKSYGEYVDLRNNFEVKRKLLIESKEQIQNAKKLTDDDCHLKIGKISMKKEFPKYDFYESPIISLQKIISEPLKNRLLEEGMTGMEIRPFPKFIVQN